MHNFLSLLFACVQYSNINQRTTSSSSSSSSRYRINAIDLLDRIDRSLSTINLKIKFLAFTVSFISVCGSCTQMLAVQVPYPAYRIFSRGTSFLHRIAVVSTLNLEAEFVDALLTVVFADSSVRCLDLPCLELLTEPHRVSFLLTEPAPH